MKFIIDCIIHFSRRPGWICIHWKFPAFTAQCSTIKSHYCNRSEVQWSTMFRILPMHGELGIELYSEIWIGIGWMDNIGLSWQNIAHFWFVLQPGRIGYWVGVGWVTNARCPRKLVSAVLGAVREGRHGIHQLHGGWGIEEGKKAQRSNLKG